MHSLLSTRARRISVLAVVPLMTLVVMSCAPNPGVPAEPPAARAVLSPQSGPAGTFVNVAPPDGKCVSPNTPYQYLQAVLTIPKTGIVVTQGFQSTGPALSDYAAPDAFVRLRIPPATAPGKYFVYLSCFSYLDSYAYAAATFTVTPS